MILIYALSFLLFGLWISSKALEKSWIPKEFLYIGSLAASLFVYYFIFFLYLFDPNFAQYVVVALLILTPLIAFSLINKCVKTSSFLKTVKNTYLPPLLISILLLITYTSIFYGCAEKTPTYGGYKEVSNRSFCHITNLPFDNALPFIYANNVLNNQDDKKALSWNLVDRPPLQIAATLPIENLSEGQNQYVRFYYYHLFAVFLQLCWVGAVWAIFARLKIKKMARFLLFAAFSATGFFYLNSVFIWPKLLAAGLVVAGMSLFIGHKRNKVPYKYLPFSSILISLGLLSHGGVVFSLVPFGILLAYRIIRSKKIGYKYISISFILAISLLLPWQLYKGSQANSDRLLKYHLAGVEASQDTRGTLQTISDQYKTLGFNQWIENKAQNTRTLITGNYNFLDNCSFSPVVVFKSCFYNQWKVLTFFSTLFAFEIFIIGIFILLYRFFKRRLDIFDKDSLFIIIGSLGFWALVMFEPGSTTVHQGSYATMILAFILLGKHLSTLPIKVFISIALFQLLLFYLTWIKPFIIL